MGIRITELHCKEVICIADGRRLGYVCDVEIDISCGKVLAIVVPVLVESSAHWDGWTIM